ncbi:MAG: RagB/SusD family nutrient uptake outer membrane protein, partial [Tannerella sp.]|nr:RagB/SusD family nutrient uptake outer membrane protein [Tannerella sp.]
YTGYYQTETLPLTDGGEITRAQVVAWLNDCIDNSGHDLVSDFRNLWPYSYRGNFDNPSTAYVPYYRYAVNNGLRWEGDGNKETLFAIKFSTIGYNFDYPQQKSNQINLYFGMRQQPEDFKYCFPFGTGWGMGTVNPKTWNDWDDADLRKKGSILNTGDRPAEITAYVRGGNNQMDETLFYQKKYMPINVWKDNGAGMRPSLQNYSYELYDMGANTDYMSNNTQDLVLIRFADVLLMHAELTNGQVIARYGTDGMNQVRRRAQLPDAPYSLDNLKRERRFELAFEGIRYYDILRWHDWDVLTVNQTDITVYNMNRIGTLSIVFRPETGGFLPIPQTQINLQEGMLTQNPGWEGAANYLN